MERNRVTFIAVHIKLAQEIGGIASSTNKADM